MKEFLLENGIYYRMNNLDKGRPVLVFVHGLSSSSSAWSEYEKRFENKYNLLFLDLRGHGKSIKFKNYDDYTISHFANDIDKLVTYLGLNKFFLISHSFATLVALQFMTSHQDKVAGAVLLSPSAKTGTRFLEKLIRPFLNLSYLFPTQTNGGHVEYSKYKGTGDWNVRRLFTDIMNTSMRVYLFCTKQSHGFDREKFLEKIHVPTLIMHGKNDTIFPVENSLIMQQKIKGSELILLDNTDHVIVLNNVNQICRAIEVFVEKYANSS